MKKTEKKTMAELLAIILFILVAVVVSAQDKPRLEKINVFAVTSETIESAFNKAATALKSEEDLESFSLQGYQIHCTLYMTLYPEGSSKQVIEAIKEIAANTPEFSINTTGLEITAGNWYFMNLDRNASLQALCNAVVEKLAPLRAKSDHIPDWAKDFPQKVEYIAKYGSPNVYDEFNPHLTFLAPSDAEKLQRFTDKHAANDFAQPVNGKIVAIGAGFADRSGQIQEPLLILPLQPIAD